MSFIKSRRQQSNRIKESGKEEAPHRGNESKMETSCTILPDEAKNTGETSHLHPPEGWLHMDVVEREKLKWMVDVSRAAPTSSRLELDKIETRFSLEGLVIPRSTDMPSHLGLHHHGDEPEVSHPRLSLISHKINGHVLCVFGYCCSYFRLPVTH